MASRFSDHPEGRPGADRSRGTGLTRSRKEDCGLHSPRNHAADRAPGRDRPGGAAVAPAHRAAAPEAKVRDARGLPEDAATTAFLDGVWGALAEATNEAHHAGHPDQAFTAADARAVLLTTAVMLEYLGASLSPGAL